MRPDKQQSECPARGVSQLSAGIGIDIHSLTQLVFRWQPDIRRVKNNQTAPLDSYAKHG